MSIKSRQRNPKRPNSNGRYKPFGCNLTAYAGDRKDNDGVPFTVEVVGGNKKDAKGKPIFVHTLRRIDW